LLIGRGIVDDVLASSRSRAILLLALPATFMYGPLGLLLYVLARGPSDIRSWARRSEA
jgi:hypothetical protein